MKLFKRAGLATLLALALCATAGAASASAATAMFTADQYEAAIAGSSTEDSQMTIFNQTIVCTAPSFTSHLSNSALSFTSQETVDKKCGWKEGYHPTLEMKGCQFTFTAGTKTVGGSTGEFSVGPEKCGPITIELYPCNVTFDPSTWSGVAKFTDNGEGKVNVLTEDSSVSFTATGLACGTKSGTARIVFAWNTTATNEAGGATGLHVRVAAPFVVGESEKHFEAPKYPLSFGSQSGSTFGFTATNGNFQCANTSVSGEIAAATTQLALAPAYGECTAKVGETTLPALVVMNGCRYTLNASGTLGVGCEGASPVEYKVYSNKEFKTMICNFKVSAQGGHESVGLSNGVSGLEASASVTGLSYERTGILCGGTLKGTNGGITYSTALAGF